MFAESGMPAPVIAETKLRVVDTDEPVKSRAGVAVEVCRRGARGAAWAWAWASASAASGGPNTEPLLGWFGPSRLLSRGEQSRCPG
jgi:hypothetical protein